MKKKFRPDLSDYLVYFEALTGKLNIERAIEKVLPDVVIHEKRKKYLRLNF